MTRSDKCMKPGRRSISFSLKSALLLGIISIISIMFIACYILIYVNIRDTIIHQHQESIVRNLESESQSLQAYLEEIERQTLVIQLDENIVASIQLKSENNITRIKMRRDVGDTIRENLVNMNGVNWICLIYQNGSMVGASSKLTSFYPESPPFMQTKDYADILHTAKGCLWFGGYNDSYFSQYPSSPYIVSTFSQDVLLCVRRISVNVQDTQNVLVFAIDEDAIYNRIGIFTKAPFDNVSLFNSSGDLMLCQKEEQADFLAQYFRSIRQNMALNSSIETINGSKTHIIVMRMKNGWSILSTVPMQYYYKAIQPMLNILFVIACVSLILINAWCALLITQATKQLKSMTGIIEQVGANRNVKMNESGFIKEYNTLSVQFNSMLRNLMDASAEKRRMEIQVLQSQIKPHFLYNTILSIRMMAAIIGAHNVADALLYLGDIIRPIFEYKNEVWHLKQEIELLDKYARLMELRFGKHAEYIIHVDEAANNVMVPRLLLQPLLENCYQHSLRDDAFITINIDVSVVADGWRLRISDNGRGMSASVLNRINQSMRKSSNDENGGIGIGNVYYRLKKYYGDDFDMQVESEPNKGTSVTISLYRMTP
jgi:two-component system, sensor histidine kinase YesM